jgi:hypothetical protein
VARSRHLRALLRKAALPGKAWPSASYIVPAFGV